MGCSERGKTINRMPPLPIVNPAVQSFPVFRNNTSTPSRPYTCVGRASFLLQAGNVVYIVKLYGVPPLDMRKAVTMLSTSVRHYERYHLDLNIRVAERTTRSCLFPFRGLSGLVLWLVLHPAKESQLLFVAFTHQRKRSTMCLWGNEQDMDPSLPDPDQEYTVIHYKPVPLRTEKNNYYGNSEGFSHTDRDADSSTETQRRLQALAGPPRRNRDSQ